jgi:pimeloyl-ACP methyl ester carboxylesterase
MEPPGDTAACPLPDGRTLDYWEGGDPSGFPVLVHPGTPGSRLFGRHLHAAAVDARVRLVVLSRPGYGGSSMLPPGLAAVAEDTLALADSLGLSRFAVLGTSGGGPNAVATGCRGPERVTCVGVLAGPGDVGAAGDDAETDEQAGVVEMLSEDPEAALAQVRDEVAAMFDPLLALDDEAFVEGFLSLVPAGPTVHSGDEHFKRYWADDLRESLRTYDGFARDSLSWGVPWDVDPATLNRPCLLWYGDADQMVPPEHGEWLAGRVPDARLTRLPGEGHAATILDHLPTVLPALVDPAPLDAAPVDSAPTP